MTRLAYLEAAMAGDRWRVDCPLRGELEAAGFPAAALRRVLELGVPAGFLGQLTGAGDLAAGRVDLSSDGARWQPGGPDARLLLGVREQGVLVDVAALKSDDPDQWALRRGEGWCLGFDAWLRCEAGMAHELRLFSTPIAWLQAGGEGCCVIDWNLGLRHLRGLGERVTITCDRGQSVALKAKLARGGLPMVAEARGDHAGLTLAERIGRKVAA